jgi:hypothetical protein
LASDPVEEIAIEDLRSAVLNDMFMFAIVVLMHVPVLNEENVI